MRILFDAGLGVATVIGLAAAGLMAGALWLRRKRPPPTEHPRYRKPAVPWSLRLALLSLVLLLGAGVVAALRGSTPLERPSRPTPPPTGVLPAQRPPTGTPSIGEDAPVVAAVSAAGLIAAALVVRRRRRRRFDAVRVGRAERPPAAGAPSGAGGVDDLLAERDPRQAVVAAYARMERVLNAAGVARRPSEAPFEYLARVKQVFAPAGPPATRLTELFERAKFSAAAVDPAMQAEAVGALRALIDEVAEAA